MRGNKKRNWIIEARKSKKYSQRKLAKLLYMSQPTINAYEHGSRSPQLPTIIKIANALDVDINIALQAELELHEPTKIKTDKND